MSLVHDVYKPNMTQDEFLRKLYYEASVAIGMALNPDASREDIITGKKGKQKSLLDMIEAGADISISTLLNSVYNARRTANISEGTEGILNLKGELKKSSYFVRKKDENNWHFRTPIKTNMNTSTKERLVVNARPDAEIIKKLDDFCTKYNCFYKIPDPDRFSDRVDTVVVYAKKELSKEEKTEFVKIMSPYVRKERTNDLDGDKLADGIFWAKETSEPQEIQNMIARFDKNMQDEITAFLKTSKGELKMSLGQRCVLEEFAEISDKIKQNQNEGRTMTDNENNTAYTEFTKAYEAAAGNIDKIEIDKLPQEIQDMFNDYDYDKQLELFDFCCKNIIDKKIKAKAKNQVNNLKTLLAIIASKESMEKQIKKDQTWYNSKEADATKGWLSGITAFLKKKQKEITDKDVLARLKTYFEFLDNPADFKIENIEEQNSGGGSVKLSNGDVNEDEPESDNKKPSSLIDHIKKSFKESGIAIKDTTENQEKYPFSYNLYEKGKNPEDEGVKPTGKLEVIKENHIALHSSDVRHFVATMRALKASGKDEIDLDLNRGTEADKKAFAANAVLAGIITGVKIEGCPYELKDLEKINPLIAEVIKLKEKQAEIRKLSDEVEQGNKAKQGDLEKGISDAIATYGQISKDTLPDKEQLRVFECGAKAVQKQKTKEIALKVIKELSITR